MKYLIVPAMLVLLSCSEEEVAPQAQDLFVGSWHLDNPDTGLKVTFNVSEAAGELSFENVNIEYPEIEGEVLSYHVETFDRFAVNAGYETIKIFGSNDLTWITLIMTHNRIHLADSDTIKVHQLEIAMINRESVILDTQIFIRSL